MSSAFRVSNTFLNSLKASFPSPKASMRRSHSRSPWYIVAAVAFSASNKPEAVSQVFAHALQDLRKQSPTANREDTLLMARKMREAIFQSGLVVGYPKAINSLTALSEVMPEELKDKQIMRNPNLPLPDYGRKGQSLFDSFYGENSNSVQQLLTTIYPDIEWFLTKIGYGVVYGNTSVISAKETAYTLVAALIATDTPRQVAWHLASAQRCGATLDEVRAVRHIAIEVAKLSGVRWQHEIPDILKA